MDIVYGGISIPAQDLYSYAGKERTIVKGLLFCATWRAARSWAFLFSALSCLWIVVLVRLIFLSY
jgi:hypothetical protein